MTPASGTTSAAGGGTQSALRCRNLSKRFGGVQAVSSVAFEVMPGGVLGILGPNGSGKTTLLNLISGVIAADTGIVYVGERNVSALAPFDRARAGLARTFQNLRLFHNLSVMDNLLIGGHTLAVAARPWWKPGGAEAARHARAETLLAMLGLAAARQRMAGTLAYGLQRRVEIARALMGEPRVLLLDEPVAGMNDAEADEIMGILHTIRQGGIAQVVIEHNVRFVTELADSILVMDAGRTLVEGAPAMIVRDPRVIEAYLG